VRNRQPDEHSPIAVIVSRQRIIGPTNGSSSYLLTIARTLRETGHEVVLLQPTPAIAGRTPILKLGGDMDLFARHSVRGALRIGRTLVFLQPATWLAAFAGVVRKLARRVGVGGQWAADRPAPYSVATPWTRADHAYLARRMPREAAIVIADYVFCSPAFAAAPETARTAILMHDLFHAREGKGEDSVAILSRSQELALLSSADAVLAIQAEEQAFVAEHVPHSQAVLVPMPAEPRPSAQPGQDNRLLFVGSMTAPNVVGLRWFLDEVWPLIRGATPAAQLAVAGTVARAFAEPPAGVSFLGLVPDLAAEYREAGVVISPLTFGSGLKIKLIEGLAEGKAMVATGITLQGVEGLCEGALLRADGARDFADAVIRLIGDPSQRQALGEAALAVVRENFAAMTAHRDLRAWIEAR
jgi:glycosyltransferase involved in cell wall biosynthesis